MHMRYIHAWLSEVLGKQVTKADDYVGAQVE